MVNGSAYLLSDECIGCTSQGRLVFLNPSFSVGGRRLALLQNGGLFKLSSLEPPPGHKCGPTKECRTIKSSSLLTFIAQIPSKAPGPHMLGIPAALPLIFMCWILLHLLLFWCGGCLSSRVTQTIKLSSHWHKVHRAMPRKKTIRKNKRPIRKKFLIAHEPWA